MRRIAARARRRLRRHGRPQPSPSSFVVALDEPVRRIVEEAHAHSMTGAERLAATVDAVGHVVGRSIPGALVECGVWRGGSVLAMIRALQLFGCDDRDVYAFDTFAGMTEPSEAETSRFAEPALRTWRRARSRGERPWGELFAGPGTDVASVGALLRGTGYPAERIHLVEGQVERSLPGRAPDRIAVLRLDTDWYASTRHELEHLYPRLSPGGVLIVDDYGHWDGCRRAVDEYFAEHPPAPLLTRIDYSARMAVKA